MWYRKLFDAPKGATATATATLTATSNTTTLMHFGAVDWNSTVYLNGV